MVVWYDYHMSSLPQIWLSRAERGVYSWPDCVLPPDEMPLLPDMLVGLPQSIVLTLTGMAVEVGEI